MVTDEVPEPSETDF